MRLPDDPCLARLHSLRLSPSVSFRILFTLQLCRHLVAAKCFSTPSQLSMISRFENDRSPGVCAAAPQDINAD
jgi:hypothetical protein